MPLLRQEGAGRHPEQSSEALGAAACHPGPRAVAHGVVLNRECGVSATKIARLFGLFGLAITAGGMVGILHLAARAAMPTCAALVEGCATQRWSARMRPRRVEGRNARQWAFVGDRRVTL